MPNPHPLLLSIINLRKMFGSTLLQSSVSFITLTQDAVALHFWEIGGGRTMIELLEVVITPQTLPNLTIFICLDFSATQPSSSVSSSSSESATTAAGVILADLLFFLDAINQRINSCKATATPEDRALMDAHFARLATASASSSSTRSMIPVDINIVCSKMDLADVDALVSCHPPFSTHPPLFDSHRPSFSHLISAIRLISLNCGASAAFSTSVARTASTAAAAESNFVSFLRPVIASQFH